MCLGVCVGGVCVCVECVYFDIKIGGKDVGRKTAQLRADVVPMTAGGCVGGCVCVWVGVRGDLLWGVCCVKCVYFDIKVGGKDVDRMIATTQG